MVPCLFEGRVSKPKNHKKSQLLRKPNFTCESLQPASVERGRMVPGWKPMWKYSKLNHTPSHPHHLCITVQQSQHLFCWQVTVWRIGLISFWNCYYFWWKKNPAKQSIGHLFSPTNCHTTRFYMKSSVGAATKVRPRYSISINHHCFLEVQ